MTDGEQELAGRNEALKRGYDENSVYIIRHAKCKSI